MRALAALGIVALVVAPLTATERTVTGLVTDATCGGHHRLADDRQCVQDCVKKGSAYALVVNGEVYTLKATAAQNAELGKLAGKVAVVRGDVEGVLVTVASVSKAKKLKKH